MLPWPPASVALTTFTVKIIIDEIQSLTIKYEMHQTPLLESERKGEAEKLLVNL